MSYVLTCMLVWICLYTCWWCTAFSSEMYVDEEFSVCDEASVVTCSCDLHSWTFCWSAHTHCGPQGILHNHRSRKLPLHTLKFRGIYLSDQQSFCIETTFNGGGQGRSDDHSVLTSRRLHKDVSRQSLLPGAITRPVARRSDNDCFMFCTVGVYRC